MWDASLWFRVPHHEQFDPERVYRAVALADYSESSTAQIVFVTDKGYLWFLSQRECVCVSHGPRFSRPAMEREMAMDLPSKRVPSDFDP